ncbi:TPA: ead/Ea22-like family protein [Enterobacter ludwigii]
MSNIDKQALRERYSEKPAPKCHICGSVMTIQRAGAGSVVYGCTGRIDKDGESYKFAEGRDFADDHYARSRVTDYGPGGDPDVLALLDELEIAEKRIAELTDDCWIYEGTVKKLLERAEAAESACSEAARILESGERMALTRSVEILRAAAAGKGE